VSLGRNFKLLFAGRAASYIGTYLAPIAVAFAILDLHGSATAVGLSFAAWTLAQVSMLSIGGVLGDRLPRRTVMIGSDVCSTAVRATMGVLLVTGHAQVWELIALQGAGGASVAFYNPASRRRTWQLAAVRDLLLRYRDPETPVVLGHGVGRPGERVTVTCLAKLDPAEVDMSTLVIVGSSQTRVHDRPGGPLVFTPRHYGDAGAAEKASLLHEQGARALTRGGNRRRAAGRAAPDDQDVAVPELVEVLDFSVMVSNGHAHRSPQPASTGRAMPVVAAAAGESSQ